MHKYLSKNTTQTPVVPTQSLLFNIHQTVNTSLFTNTQNTHAKITHPKILYVAESCYFFLKGKDQEQNIKKVC